MTKQLKKVLSILCAISLLVSGMVFALAEEESATEQNVAEQPVVAETVAEAPAAVETVAEAPAAVETVAEAPAAVETVVEAPAAVETVAEAPTAVETVAEAPAAVETVAEAPAAVETVAEAPAAVETVAEVPAEAETVAEAPAAVEPADEAPAAAETAPEAPAAEEPADEAPAAVEPADEEPATEEPAADEPVADEPVSEADEEEIPAIVEPTIEEPAAEEPAQEDASNEEEIEGWGWIDSAVIEENTPAITDAFKGLRNAEMSVGEMLIDTLNFDEELTVTLKGSNASTIELKLYTNSIINTKVDGKNVGFTPADSDVPSMNLYVYELDNAAGRDHEIVLTSNDNVSFRLAAVVKQSAAVETPAPAEEVPAEESNEEEIPAGETVEVIPAEDTVEENPAEETGEEIPAEETSEEIPAEETSEEIPAEENNEGIIPEENNEEVPAEEMVTEIPAEEPVVTPEPTIQASVKTYNALKVGSQITDTLVTGQKAKVQVKCGKNPFVTLTLNANPDDLTVTIDGDNAQFTPAGNGTYTVELNNVAFRKFSIVISAKQELAFTLSASVNQEALAAADVVVSEETAEEDEEEETEEELIEETTVETAGEEATEEEAVEETNEEVETEVMEIPAEEETTDTEEPSEESAEEANETNEATAEEDEGEETEAVESDNEEEPITEETEEEAEQFVLPEDRSVSFDIYWDGEAVLGEIAHFRATLVGYDGLDYTIQWQQSTDDMNWVDIEGANEETMDVLATEETNSLYYRITVIIHTPDDYVAPEESVSQD